MDLWRFIVIYIILGTICAFFLFISHKVLKRDPKNRLNQVLGAFYITVAAALMINFIYGFISNPSLQSLVSFLNVLTIFLITFGTGFLLLFIIMIYRPGFMSTIKSQILFLILYGTILIGIFFIPNGSEVRILKDGTQLSPVWNYPFTLYISIHLTSSLLILLILSFKTYKKFENEILARRLKYFDIGILIYYYIALGAAINNFLDIPIFRIIYAISSLITFAGVLFLYYSIGTNVNIPFPTNHSKF